MKTFKFWCSYDKGTDKEDAKEIEITRHFGDSQFSDLVEEAAQDACSEGLFDRDDGTNLTVYVVDETSHEWEVDVTVDWDPRFSGSVDIGKEHNIELTIEEAEALITANKKEE